MFNDLGIFQAASQMARHAFMRQGVISTNIANSNTPGYKARDLKGFQHSIENTTASNAMAVSRPGHVQFASSKSAGLQHEDKSAVPSPNGNSVSIEREILKSVEAERQHSRAIAIYQSGLSLLRTSIGRGR